jgi:inner membrane protein
VLPLAHRLAVGAVAAAFPDIDFVANVVSPLTYLLNHRGVTHSLLLLPFWALLLALLAARIWPHRQGWRAYYGLAAMGLAAHIVGDLITSYGTMVFAPLSAARFAWNTTFIIDLWFSGIILAGLLASLVWRRSRIPAVVATLTLAGYVGLQVLLRNEAQRIGERYAAEAALDGAEVTAQPGAVSPFNWAVYVRTGNSYRYAYLDLLHDEPSPAPGPDAGFIDTLSAPFQPPRFAVWRLTSLLGPDPDRALVKEAWSQPALAFFRWFAQFPALYRIDRGEQSLCVWFHDLRFWRPGTTRLPFRFGVCRRGNGAWQRFQLLSDDERVPFR